MVSRFVNFLMIFQETVLPLTLDTGVEVSYELGPIDNR